MRKVVLDLRQADLSTEAYRQKMNIDSKWSIRLRPSMAHALTEVAKGLFRMYPHKLQLGIKAGQSPNLYQFSEGIARDGIKILEFTEKDSVDEIVSTLSDETSFFILSEDHPVTGELFAVEDLIKKITDKKIFTIVIRHHNHLLVPNRFVVNPYLVELRDHQSYAAILLGSRTKKIDPLLLVPDMTAYNFEDKTLFEDQKLVSDFEASIQKLAGIRLYFEIGSSRIWDRVVFALEKNAEPLYQILKRSLQKGEILCTSKCVQNHPFNFSWWTDSKFTEETMQQWLVMDLEAISECQSTFSASYDEFLQLTKA